MDLSTKEHVSCPLCHQDEPVTRYKIAQWTVVQCRRCDFVYVNPRLTRPALLDLYRHDYFDNTDVGYLHYTENKELRKRNFERWITDATPFLTPSADINALDIGCAAGYCLDIFKSRGWRPTGIELDNAYALQLEQNGYRVFHEPFMDIRFTERYHLITLFDVIEHLTDLKQHFSKLHSILHDDGIVVLITPDYNSIQRKLLGRRWFQFKPVEHINYFSADTLRSLADATGFTIAMHARSGQYSNAAFLAGRLRKYRFGFLIPAFMLLSTVLRLQKKYLYVDTASLYVILKKKR